MNAEDHNKYLAYSFLAHAGIQFLWMILMSIFFLGFFLNIPGDPGPANGIFLMFMVFIVGFHLLFALPSAIAGFGLLNKKSWARVWSIIGAVTAALNVPIGTAVCIYALWFFFGDEWKKVYEDEGYSESTVLFGPADFEKWEAEAAQYEREREKEPRRGEWR